MDDVFRIAIVLVGIIFAGFLATCNLQSVVGGPASSIVVKPESPSVPGVSGVLDVKFDAEQVLWGNISPGGFAERSVLVMNYGCLSASLSLSAEKFVPVEAEQFLKLSWNLEGYVLEPGKNVAAVFRLDVSSDVWEISKFSFTVVVSAVA